MSNIPGGFKKTEVGLIPFAPGKERIVVMPDRFDIPVVTSDPQYQRIGGV
jgi:hypothetical protein